MKRILCTAILLLIVVLVFSGCNMLHIEIPSATETATQEETAIQTQPVTETNPDTQPTELTEPETEPYKQPDTTAYLQKTGYINGNLCYTNDHRWEYIQNSVVSTLPDSIKDKIGSFFIIDDYIYYIPMVGGSGGFSVELRRMKTDGSGDELIADDYSYGGKCQYSDGRIMYECFDDEQARYGTAIIDVNTKEIFYYNDIHNGVLHNGKMLYYYSGISLRCMDIETGEEKDIFTEEGNIFSYDGDCIYYTTDNGGSLKRYNIADDEREFIGNSFGYTYTVKNNTVYWVASEENTAKIYAFDIESKKESFIADIDPVNGVHRLAAENGYLLYTVGKYNDMGNNASDYIFDLNTGTSTLISDYHVAQF